MYDSVDTVRDYSTHSQTTGYENLAAARLAIEDINADKTFLPGYHFDMLFKDDGCDMEIGLKALTNAYDNDENK